MGVFLNKFLLFGGTLGMSMQGHPLVEGIPPAWASEWGEDDFGPFVVVRVGEVEQRFRWIPEGTFWMGSLESEDGRDDDEVEHLVTLTQGFWLADTPCTQALWQEVMGENPSRFQSPQRPVEQVSWEDCQAFMKQLADRVEGLQPRLPTEAEWERACRAGTETASWLGDVEILGSNNAPALDSIAWYGGNCGVDYDLEEFTDSSGWPEKQYDHERAGTRKVATKQANPWGLYDMLGNVREWCADWEGTYPADHQVDPEGPEEGSDRVIRGGSWTSRARGVRAASRFWFDPGYRYVFLGFRLALGGVRRRGVPHQESRSD